MTAPGSLDGFIDKWRARWPEWGIAEAFIARDQRPRAAAWFALLQELRDAAWAGSEPAPGLAKLAWWQEELRGWARGARRHPLGEALQRLDADWEALGRALAALPATRDPDDLRADHGALRTWVGAVLACEADLFGGVEPPPGTVDACVGAHRVERALARGDLDAALRQQADLGHAAALSRPRRLHQAVLRERLRLTTAEDAGLRRVPPLRMLWAGWRAARG
ncbi:phytoene/squalene synthase family protein [Luteimonas kalidii]|uniref:Phytoene/squalene synthase family protein n=1 Tax=Luteimonas kalidii TaxID=3042025 RepID=A0ABT6JUJ6_9GAMM|nr:phytoene/squalene synthase family protein [Luteimonas kalidii]MDH5834150.1 phytoene/squalene synthase family protein [Luteimonas kalidii]